jgi:hypothetical protein
MPKPVWVSALAMLLLSGCSAPTATPPAQNDGSDGRLILDDAGDAPLHHDLIRLEAKNLNGSLMLDFTFDNITLAPGSRHPLYNATMRINSHTDGFVTAWAALVPDFNRGHPHIAARVGRFTAQGAQEWGACYVTSTGEPAHVYHDVSAMRLGFRGGGVLERVEVRVTNGTDPQSVDEAVFEGKFALRGGENPYAPVGTANPDNYCPLFRDPGSPVQQGG